MASKKKSQAGAKSDVRRKKTAAKKAEHVSDNTTTEAVNSEPPTTIMPMAFSMKDPDKFARNMAQMMEEIGKAAANWVEPREKGEMRDTTPAGMAEMSKALSRVYEYWLADPERSLKAHTDLMGRYMNLWHASVKRMAGEDVASPLGDIKPDSRFKDEAWQKDPFFSFLKDAYLMTSHWLEGLVERTEGLDEHTKHKAIFYTQQMINSLSPTNFPQLNPEVLRETFESDGENLVRGMKMLAEDINAGKGVLKLRQSDTTAFEVGRDVANTPGRVIHRNEVCELIQYEPSTETVLKRPLLIVPPWINKFYILDLNERKSFIRWCVNQGHTVFVVSWINPDENQAGKSFDHYAAEGILESLDVIEDVTGERQVNAIGYCVGGTLLAATLAMMAREKDDRIASATFFTTQVDFTHAGDLKVFVDEEQISTVERTMADKGYLDGAQMATAFNMLRSRDLIWPYMVNNYLKGKNPMPFDLLYWNSDSTRMPAANHSFYLRNCYLENKLSKGEMVLGGDKVSLGDIKIPIYNLATREDHIAPAKSAYIGSQFFGGPVEFVLTGSGHIAGVVNPPANENGGGKYQYWTGPKPVGDIADWMPEAQETEGSWWPHWHRWVEEKAPARIPARTIGSARYAPKEPAPGTYVRIKA